MILHVIMKINYVDNFEFYNLQQLEKNMSLLVFR